MLFDVIDVKDRLEMLGVVVSDSDDKAINFAINKTVKWVLDYCNIEKLPEAIRELVIDMACSEFIQMKLATGQNIGDAFEELTESAESIKLGDTTVSFSDSNNQATLFKRLLDNMLDYSKLKVLLAKHRRLKWPAR